MTQGYVTASSTSSGVGQAWLQPLALPLPGSVASVHFGFLSK